MGLFLLLLTLGAIQAYAEWPHVVPSEDGTSISYEVFGAGEPTLVFVHEHVDFYGPVKEHPENYLGSTVLDMVKRCREHGIAEISCVDGLALFRIHSLTGKQKPGNVLTDPETPFQYLLNYL